MILVLFLGSLSPPVGYHVFLLLFSLSLLFHYLQLRLLYARYPIILSHLLSLFSNFRCFSLPLCQIIL